MSTRANIIVTDSYGSELIFYRHSDGYPEGAMPTLEKFMRYVKEDRIRNNVGQAAGWLIVLGREEYAEYHDKTGEPRKDERAGGFGSPDWKVGSIEPTYGIHGDIEWLYIVDLAKKEIRQSQDFGPEFYSGKFSQTVAA